MPFIVCSIAIALLLLFSSGAVSHAAGFETSNSAWLQDSLAKLGTILSNTNAQLVKQEETIRAAENLSKRATEKNNSDALAAAQAALRNAQRAKQKTLLTKAKAEEAIEKFRRLIETLQRNKSDEKVRECARLYERLQRDVEISRNRLDRTEQANKELEEWAAANEEAAQDALYKGVQALTAGVTAYLERLEYSKRGFKGWVTRYKKELEQKGVDVDAVTKKLDLEEVKYLKADAAVKFGKLLKIKTLKKGFDVAEVGALIKNEVSAIAIAIEKNNASVREMLQDPTINEFINRDNPGIDMQLFTQEKLLETLLEIGGIKTLPVAFGDFVVQYVYDAKKWYESRERILQQNEVNNQELVAVKAWDNVLKKDMERFKGCKSQLLEREGISLSGI